MNITNDEDSFGKITARLFRKNYRHIISEKLWYFEENKDRFLCEGGDTKKFQSQELKWDVSWKRVKLKLVNHKKENVDNKI